MIVVTRFKLLIGGFSFGWFLIVTLKCFSFCDRRAKEFKVSKYFAKYICSALDREVRRSSIVVKFSVEANLSLLLACSQN